MTPGDLTTDELGWLLGLATQRRKERERSLGKMRRKPGQEQTKFELAHRNVVKSLEWARSVEDHLIRLIGDADENSLRGRSQRERYKKLRAAA